MHEHPDKCHGAASPVLASIVVPCFNSERWLPRFFTSVFAALPQSCEVIAVDDGSTDGTAEALRAEAARHPALRVISLPHGGVSRARNAALDAARGEFVLFADPDDEVAPDFVSGIVSAMRRNISDCCVCGYRTVRADGTFFDTAPQDCAALGSHEEIVRRFLPRILGYSRDDVLRWNAGGALWSGREMAYACRFGWRMEAVRRARARFDESLALNEDMVFAAECLCSCRSMSFVREPLYVVRERATGASASVRRDAAEYCRNKLALLAARRRLDAAQGGALEPLFECSLAFSALEIASLAARLRLPPTKGLQFLREYLGDAAVRRALRRFPISPRRPLAAIGITALRAFAAAFSRRDNILRSSADARR